MYCEKPTDETRYSLDRGDSLALKSFSQTSCSVRDGNPQSGEVEVTCNQPLPVPQSSIEAVAEMLLENSKHLPYFTQITKQGTRPSIYPITGRLSLQVNEDCINSKEITDIDSSKHSSTSRYECCTDSKYQQVAKLKDRHSPSYVQGENSVNSSPNGEVQRIFEALLCRRQLVNDADNVRNEITGHEIPETSTPSLIRMHKCPECDKLFPRESCLKRHILVHVDGRPYQCTKCDADYKSSSQLRRHMHLHTGEKPAQCEQCGKTFHTYNELYTHRRTHTGEKPYDCKFCGKCFSTRGYRNTHERIHTGEKRFECDICGMKFTESSARRVHRFTHTGETPYVCQICGRGFTQAGNMSKHMKAVHSKDKPFKCKQCVKEFGVKQDLTRHLSRVHSTNKPYQCRVCGKKYGLYSDLTRHKKTHKGQCNSTCSRSGNKVRNGEEIESDTVNKDCIDTDSKVEDRTETTASTKYGCTTSMPYNPEHKDAQSTNLTECRQLGPSPKRSIRSVGESPIRQIKARDA